VTVQIKPWAISRQLGILFVRDAEGPDMRIPSGGGWLASSATGQVAHFQRNPRMGFSEGRRHAWQAGPRIARSGHDGKFGAFVERPSWR
jgi:hypothetical protein